VNAENTQTKTIVFVEDNPVVLMAYRNHLAQQGFHIKPAKDGLEALKILSRLVPDVVILDLMLPKFDGVDVLKFIQTNSRLKAVPVIILSAKATIDPAEEYVLESANRRLLKGECTPALLLQAVRELLAHPSAQSGVSSANQSDDSKPTESKTGSVPIDIHVAT